MLSDAVLDCSNLPADRDWPKNLPLHSMTSSRALEVGHLNTSISLLQYLVY